MASSADDERELNELLQRGGFSHLAAFCSRIAEHYPALRDLCGRLTRGRTPGEGLSATELVHEAFLQLVGQERIAERGSAFFLACFAQQCRRILVDDLRARRTKKRGGDVAHETLCDDVLELAKGGSFDLIELDEAIEVLSRLSPRMAQIVDMRVFSGMSVQQCAEVLNVSTRTIDNDWAAARTWLRKELG